MNKWIILGVLVFAVGLMLLGGSHHALADIGVVRI
jgi:hypothetical protein